MPVITGGFNQAYMCLKNFITSWKNVFFATFLCGLAAHGYALMNYLPTWDSISYTTSVGATYSSGRWLLGLVGKLFSDYSVPWLNGIVSLFFIALTAIIFIKIFEVKNEVFKVLIPSLLVTFPTVVSTFAYMYTADCYMLAFFLAVLSVYCCKFYKKYGVLLGCLCLCAAIAIYQTYISVTIATVIVLFINESLFTETTFKEKLAKYLRYVVAVVCGYLLYTVVLKIVLAIFDSTLTGYQGIGKMEILSPYELVRAFAVNVMMIFDFFGLEFFEVEGREFKIGVYAIINILLLLLLIVYTFFLLKKKMVQNKVLVLAALVLLPISICLIRYFTVDVRYSTLLMMSVSLIYILIMVNIDKADSNIKYVSVMNNTAVLLICVLIIYNTINANANYTYMDMRYERTYALASTVLDDVTSMKEYRNQTETVAIIGTSENISENNWNDTYPFIRGSENADTVLNAQTSFINFWRDFLGVELRGADPKQVEKIMQNEGYEEMPTYPQPGYVAYVDGVIVVKISDGAYRHSA